MEHPPARGRAATTPHHPARNHMAPGPALWQRAPAPDAPLKRGISFAKTRRFRAADYSPRPAPVRGTFAVAWNIAVRTRGVFTHRTGFQKLACVERGLVRTGWRGGEAAGGNRWRKRISAGAGVSRWEQAQVQSETGSRQKAGTDRRSGSRQEQAGTGQTEQEQASASKDKRRCNQRQVAGRRRERTDGAGAGEDKREEEQASASKDKRRCNQRQMTSAGRNKRERDRRSRSKRQQVGTSAGAIRDR